MNTTRLQRNFNHLNNLLKSTGARRKVHLKGVTADVIKAIADAVKAILAKKISVTARQLNKYKKKKGSLRRLGDPRTSVAAKRKLLIQDGGLLGFIAPVLKVVGPLVGGLLNGLTGGLIGGRQRR